MKMITAVIACLTLLSSAQAQFIKNLGKNVSNVGKNISNSAKQVESNIQHAPDSLKGKKQHGSQSHHKQSKPSQHDTKSTEKNAKPAEQKLGTHKAEQKLGTSKAGQKHVDPNPPVSAGQKNNAQATAKPANANGPINSAAAPGVLTTFGDTNTPKITPGTPGSNNKQIIINSPALRPAQAQDLAVQTQLELLDRQASGETYRNKSGVQPPLKQDRNALLRKLNVPYGP